MKQKKKWGLRQCIDLDHDKNERNLKKKDGVWDKLQIRIERGNVMMKQKKRCGLRRSVDQDYYKNNGNLEKKRVLGPTVLQDLTRKYDNNTEKKDGG